MGFNSTIKPKQGICLDCSKEGFIIAGRCPRCYNIFRNKKSRLKREQKQSKIKMNLSQPKPKAIKDTTELNQWFLIKENIIARKPRCWNCNEYIPLAYYRAAVAHIFPKAIFESVATHDENFVVAAAGCGCHNKTHRIDLFKEMPIFPLAVTRFKRFQPEILEKHKYLDLFIEAAKEKGLL